MGRKTASSFDIKPLPHSLGYVSLSSTDPNPLSPCILALVYPLRPLRPLTPLASRYLPCSPGFGRGWPRFSWGTVRELRRSDVMQPRSCSLARWGSVEDVYAGVAGARGRKGDFAVAQPARRRRWPTIYVVQRPPPCSRPTPKYPG